MCYQLYNWWAYVFAVYFQIFIIRKNIQREREWCHCHCMPCCITGPAFVKGGARCHEELIENEMFSATWQLMWEDAKARLVLQTVHWEGQMGLMGCSQARV